MWRRRSPLDAPDLNVIERSFRRSGFPLLGFLFTCFLGALLQDTLHYLLLGSNLVLPWFRVVDSFGRFPPNPWLPHRPQGLIQQAGEIFVQIGPLRVLPQAQADPLGILRIQPFAFEHLDRMMMNHRRCIGLFQAGPLQSHSLRCTALRLLLIVDRFAVAAENFHLISRWLRNVADAVDLQAVEDRLLLELAGRFHLLMIVMV